MKPLSIWFNFSLYSDHDEEEEDEDNMSFQFADQEEEYLNRIKEESRRRSRAILEKYKCQQLEKQVKPSLKESEKGNFQISIKFKISAFPWTTIIFRRNQQVWT